MEPPCLVLVQKGFRAVQGIKEAPGLGLPVWGFRRFQSLTMGTAVVGSACIYVSQGSTPSWGLVLLIVGFQVWQLRYI